MGARGIRTIIEKTQDLTQVAHVLTDSELREKLTPLQYKVTQQ
jgi:hypothetical protein